MPLRFALVTVLSALAISPVMAQVRSAGSVTAGFGISGGSPGTSSSGIGTAGPGGIHGPGVVGGVGRFHPGHHSGRPAILLQYPYLYSDSDTNYDSREVPQPQVIVVSATPPAPPAAPARPLESLLIEWQGDHFVRTTMSAHDSAGQPIAPDYAEKSTPPLSAAVRSAQERKNAVQPSRELAPRDLTPHDLPPAVLVFHDGRTEEVSEYTIMSGVIYSKADYWTTGSWTRKIQIADLDVPATLKLNQERGLKFMLPSGPNQIVTRP